MASKEETYRPVKVYPWRNKQQFEDTYNLIYSSSSTNATKKRACDLLMVWKLRRAQETPNSILCTYALLEAHLKDELKIIKGNSSLCTIYSAALTKFVNFAISSIPGNMTMYRAAEVLGIHSYIIDIRHICSHGTETPHLEVFRKCNAYCLEWLKTHYWEKEIAQLQDVLMSDIKSLSQHAHEAQVSEMFLVLDTTIEGLSMGYVNFEDVENDESWTETRKNVLKNCLVEFKSTKLMGIKNYVRDWLIKCMSTKAAKDYTRPMFRLFIQKCEFIMKTVVAVEENGNQEGSPPKKMRKKQSSNILVKQYINFYIREVVTEGFLPDFLEELFQVFNNKSEFDDKRTIVKKWILILLKSFKAYKDYSDLQESLDHVMAVKKVDKEIENTYVEKLKLNLDEIFIFAGCRVLPSSLKFPRSILARHLKSLSSDNKEICESILPFINPPFNPEKSSLLCDLIQIQTQEVKNTGEPVQDVFTATDLKDVLKIESKAKNNSESGWKLCTADINWSNVPLGTFFT